MIKKIRFFDIKDIDLCNDDNKPCKFIILIGNNSTGKTFTIENLNKDFQYNPLIRASGFKYIFFVNNRIQTYNWCTAPSSIVWMPKCLYIPSLSKNIQSSTVANQLIDCNELTKKLNIF